MAIEFRCSQCTQLLRVPETAAGKSARCPKCQALMTVPSATAIVQAPAGSQPADPFAPASPPISGSPSAPPPTPSANPFPNLQPLPPKPPENQFGSGTYPSAAPPPKPAAENPFAGGGSSPFGASPDNLNPYASPSAAAMQPPAFGIPSLPINPRPVAADAIFNYAWQIWKENLGLLIGVTITIVAISYAIAIPIGGAQEMLKQQGEEQAAAGVAVIGQLVNNILQMWLGIGHVQINLKLARRQPAAFSDLFGGMGQFLPVFGASILAGIAFSLGLLLLVVPGVLMALAFWPYYYLIVDRKASVLESFSVASTITNGNWGSAFVLSIMSLGIFLLGCLALCIGWLFAWPLLSMMFAVAYLMMSGQLDPYYAYPTYAAPYQTMPNYQASPPK